MIAVFGAIGCASDAGVDDLTNGVGGGGGTTKVTICHIPPGNPSNAHTITVGAPAVPAHLAHGDTLGPCGDAGVAPPPDAGVALPPDAGVALPPDAPLIP